MKAPTKFRKMARLAAGFLLVIVSSLATVFIFDAGLRFFKNGDKKPKGVVASFSPYAPRFDSSEVDQSRQARYPQVLPGGVVVPQKNVTARSIVRTRTGELIYDVTYHTDEFRRRITPGQEGPRKKHAIFMGCSWTYGEGVEDDETVPFYFSKIARDYRSYNFANHGNGINDILAKARYREEDNWAGITEEEGVAVYVHAFDHVRRLIGTMFYLGTYGQPHPYLKESADGQIMNMGSFREARPWLTKFSEIFAEREFVKYFSLDFPKIQAEHWRFFAKVVEAVKNEYLTRFPKGKFLVVVLPRINPEKSPLPRYLEELGISFVDYSSKTLEDYVGQKSYLNPDPHFTPAANKVLGRLTFEAVKKK